MKIYKSYFWFVFLIHNICLVFLLTSCSQKSYTYKAEDYSFHSADGSPDYSNLQYWAAHPWKYDPSDNIPKPLKKINTADSLADVFFIYPTSLTDYNDTSWNASIDDEALNKKTDGATILYQASVFNESCRVFAPRYRQAHIRCFFMPKENTQPYFDIAYNDVKKAFDYYLLHYNNGRPIIIAAHSQGTLHAKRLLKEYFDGKPLQQKLVCAYIIGLPIPEDYFSILKPCTDSLATGCFVGWRTFHKGYEPLFVKEEKFKSIVVNPLTWTLLTDPAPSSLNKGAILRNFDKLVTNAVSTQIHGNILWSSKPDFLGKIFLTTKNYHVGDINLFYMNIRENVKTRINSYTNTINQVKH